MPMDEPSTCEEPSAQILMFRAAARKPASAPENLIGRKPVETGRRFVYDVKARRGGYAVTFEGAEITRHPDRQTAVDNARLIAGNFWARGVPTLVRTVEDDGTITPIISFG
jgi:hypothetical protein